MPRANVRAGWCSGRSNGAASRRRMRSAPPTFDPESRHSRYALTRRASCELERAPADRTVGLVGRRARSGAAVHKPTEPAFCTAAIRCDGAHPARSCGRRGWPRRRSPSRVIGRRREPCCPTEIELRNPTSNPPAPSGAGCERFALRSGGHKSRRSPHGVVFPRSANKYDGWGGPPGRPIQDVGTLWPTMLRCAPTTSPRGRSRPTVVGRRRERRWEVTGRECRARGLCSLGATTDGVLPRGLFRM